MSLSVGGTQWLFLKRKFYKVGWWVLASALGWAISVILGLASSLSMMTRGEVFFYVISPLVGGMVIGGIGGIVSGVMMIQLLRRSRSRM